MVQCTSYFDKIYFYIAFYKTKSSKMCNFMMHDWVIKHIVTAAHLIFSIRLSCVTLGYFTVKVNNQVPHLHAVATTHKHFCISKGCCFLLESQSLLELSNFKEQDLTFNGRCCLFQKKYVTEYLVHGENTHSHPPGHCSN